MKLISREVIYRDENVYDIEVADNHNYCLTDKEIIVHNSGKGFVSSKLLGVEGITFDVDRLKELVMASEKYNKIAKDKFGIDVSKLDLKKSEDVSKLHDVVSSLDIPDKKMKKVLTSVLAAAPDRKPNLIFDVTLKDLNKFYNTLRNVEEMGYWKKNISLVWVLNTIDVAQAQNKERSRVVPEEILLATHQGASYTMSEILKMSNIKKYLDGDIYIAFNQAKIDSDIEKSDNGGMYIKQADYIQLKEKGKSPIAFKDIKSDIIQKIQRYVPNANVWKD
jgi:hypothetical protein